MNTTCWWNLPKQPDLLLTTALLWISVQDINPAETQASVCLSSPQLPFTVPSYRNNEVQWLCRCPSSLLYSAGIWSDTQSLLHFRISNEAPSVKRKDPANLLVYRTSRGEGEKNLDKLKSHRISKKWELSSNRISWSCQCSLRSFSQHFTPMITQCLFASSGGKQRFTCRINK